MEKKIILPKHVFYVLTIENKEYKLPFSLLIKDLKEIERIDLLNIEKKEKAKEYLFYILKIQNDDLDESIISKINIDEIEEYVNLFVKKSFQIEKQKEIKDIVDPYTKLWIAVKLKIDITNKEIESTITKLTNINEGDILRNINKYLTDLGKSIIELNKIMQKSAIKTIIENIGDIFSSIGKLYEDSIRNFTELNIPEKRKNELLSSFKKWGEYGWTVLENGPFNMFFTEPKSFEEANKIGIELLDKKEMEKIFEYLIKNCNRKTYIKEAITTYRENLYTSSSTLLFSIIDGSIIKEKFISKEGKMKVGYGAITGYKKRYEKRNSNIVFYEMLSNDNLFCALQQYFLNANNFKAKYKLLNRNYLSHGMMKRKVKKIECQKIFVLLYNLTKFQTNE